MNKPNAMFAEEHRLELATEAAKIADQAVAGLKETDDEDKEEAT